MAKHSSKEKDIKNYHRRWYQWCQCGIHYKETFPCRKKTCYKVKPEKAEDKPPDSSV